MGSITQQLEQAYAQASMRDAAKQLRSPQEWQRLRDIQRQSRDARQTEQDSFRQDYPARLADARDAILKERASRHYTHPAPQSAIGRDRFNKDQIERQAHLRVHNAHEQSMAKIDVQERREIKRVMGLGAPEASSPNQGSLQSRPIRRER